MEEQIAQLESALASNQQNVRSLEDTLKLKEDEFGHQRSSLAELTTALESAKRDLEVAEAEKLELKNIVDQVREEIAKQASSFDEAKKAAAEQGPML